jgi:hypothetical protein
MAIEQQLTLTRPLPVQVCEDVDDNAGYTSSCPICFDEFKDMNTVPIELGCSHKFCRECFENHFVVCIQQRKDVECPLCRGLICKNVSPVIVTVTTPPTTTATTIQPTREELCFNRTLVMVPLVSIIIVVIVLVIWASAINKM